MPKKTWLDEPGVTTAVYRNGAIEAADQALANALGGMLSPQAESRAAKAVVQALAEWGMIPLELAQPPERFPKLVASAIKLGPNALAVLEEVASRLAKNADRDFDDDRDLRQESYEEMIDRLTYEIVNRKKELESKSEPVAWMVSTGTGSKCVSADLFVPYSHWGAHDAIGGRLYHSADDATRARESAIMVRDYKHCHRATPLYADSVRRTG
jgi:hypothetical protein